MNKPSPLIPEGSLLQQRGNPNVRIAVFTIVAIHAVFFVGLLMQGCRREAVNSGTPDAAATNAMANYLAPMNTNYYTSYEELVGASSSTVVREPAANNAASLPDSSTAAATSATGSQGTALRTDRTAVSSLPPARAAETREHSVSAGDNFYKLSKDYGVSAQAIAKANPSVDPRRLRIGQKIQIPAAEAAPEPARIEDLRNVHVVKAGETLTSIAKQHGTEIKALKEANALATDRIFVGQKLKLPAPVHAAASSNRVMQ